MHNENQGGILSYKVGGLLYTPALNKGIANKIVTQKIKDLTSIAFCLEDSITDNMLTEAEMQLKETLLFLSKSKVELPLVFVRVRSADHLKKVHSLFRECESVITGYVLPKFDLSNCGSFCEQIVEYNASREKPLYIMPILESKAVADIGKRVDNLWAIKQYIDEIREYVLNVRVGGNDFTNMYGIRRTESQTIYQIGVIRDILVDIINVFASDYVVSAPVWEYFGKNESQAWATGLRREIELDQLNGFLGKTAIHPSQLPIIFESLKVRKSDYEDAKTIVGWNGDGLAVAKGYNGQRMNEKKCHEKWAKRVLTLASIYGFRPDNYFTGDTKYNV